MSGLQHIASAGEKCSCHVVCKGFGDPPHVRQSKVKREGSFGCFSQNDGVL